MARLPLGSVPAPARWLGLAGLVPFAALAAAAWTLPTAADARLAGAALLAYAATIASFLGAVHWGLAFHRLDETGAADLPATASLVWGVTPAVVAWALLLVELLVLPDWPDATAWALIGMLALLLGCWAVDEARREPAWWRPHYLPLRRALTLGAGLAVAAAVAGLFAR
jgi:hypothetical protein